MSGGCHIGLFDVESVKRNNNNNIHYNLQIKKKGKDECASSTHRPTSFTNFGGY